jgi:hypothetical protein
MTTIVWYAVHGKQFVVLHLLTMVAGSAAATTCPTRNGYLIAARHHREECPENAEDYCPERLAL